MKKIIYLIFLTFLTSGCSFNNHLEGVWSFELNLQGKKIPFYIKFNDKKAILKNNTELIKLTYEIKNDQVTIPILHYDAALVFERTSNILKGHWIKYNREQEYKLSVFGMKTSKQELPASSPRSFPINENMKIVFQDNKYGILTHSNKYPHSSVVTSTGDYRYLTSKKIKNKYVFYGFDGLFAFYLEGKLDQKSRYMGTLYAGKSYHKKFVAYKDNQFKLKDPNKITTLSGDLTKIKLDRLNGQKEQPLITKGKINIIQIFGSWCPNCIDETKFFLEWKKENPQKDVMFKIVSFERAKNKKHALKLLKKTKTIHKIDYPIYIGGYTSATEVTDVFINISEFISFPTSIMVDQKGNIINIHAGFNGPATGQFFERFKQKFNQLINNALD